MLPPWTITIILKQETESRPPELFSKNRGLCENRMKTQDPVDLD